MKVTFLGQTRFIPLENGEGGGSGGSGGGNGTGGGAGDNSGGEGGAGAGEGKSGGEKGGQEGDKTFTQADVDAAIKDRLAREKKKTDGAIGKLQKQLDELSGKSDGKEGENSGGENNDAITKANALLASANLRILGATATTEAVKLGVDPKYVADAVRLADLSNIEVGEDGKVDEAAVSKALDAVLKRMPVLKGNSGGDGQQGGGFRVGGEGGKGKQNENGWKNNQQNSSQQEQPTGKRWNRFR